MSQLIDGKALSQKVKDEIKIEVDNIKEQGMRVPCLAVIIVGNDPASHVYVNNKNKACEAVGFKSIHDHLPEETTTEELLDLVDKYNNDDGIDGLLVQLPLPEHIDEKKIIYSIIPEKDVDGFHPWNIGLINIGDDAMVSCTPAGIMRMFDEYGIELEGKTVTVVGWGNIAGRPLSTLLLRRNATVTVCNVYTRDLEAQCRYADIIVAAAGVPGLIKEKMVKYGAVVIDVGINRTDKGLVGDVDFEAVSKKTSYITPVPGGVGPMTIAMLLDNTLKAYKAKI